MTPPPEASFTHFLNILKSLLHPTLQEAFIMPSDDQLLRKHLIPFLRGQGAHVDFASAVKGFPSKHYGTRPDHCPHSAWELVEHIRFTLRDLVEFCTNPTYTAPVWPDEYWPKAPAPPSPQAWKDAVAAVQHDIENFERLLNDQASNLYEKILWGDGQNLLHEVFLAIDHTSYHTGQIVLIRQLLGIWK